MKSINALLRQEEQQVNSYNNYKMSYDCCTDKDSPDANITYSYMSVIKKNIIEIRKEIYDEMESIIKKGGLTMETTWFVAYEIISYLDSRETHHEPDYIKAMWCADLVAEIKLGDCSAYFDRLRDELEYDKETVQELIDSLKKEMEVYRCFRKS